MVDEKWLRKSSPPRDCSKTLKESDVKNIGRLRPIVNVLENVISFKNGQAKEKKTQKILRSINKNRDGKS